MHVNRDPRLLRARAIPATEFSRGATANVPGTGSSFKKDVKNIRNQPNKSFSINKSSGKTNPNEVETKRKNVLKIRKKAKTNRKTDLTGEE